MAVFPGNNVLSNPHGVDRNSRLPDYNSDGDSMFIPEIWSSKLLEKFYDATIFNAISNTDYEGEIKNKGDKVIIRTRPSLSVKDYETGGTLSYENPKSDAKEMNIDKAKYFAFELMDVDAHQSDLSLMDEWATDGSEQMKIAIDRSVLGEYESKSSAYNADPETQAIVWSIKSGVKGKAHAENKGAAAGRISGNIALGTDATPLKVTKDDTATAGEKSITELIVDMGTVLDEQNVPENGRWLVIPAWAAGMIKKSDLKDASLAGDATSIMRNGRLGMIDRFTIYISNLLPASMGSDSAVEPAHTTGTTVYFGTNAAISFASQITKMETVRDKDDFGDYIRSLQVYGFEVLRNECLGEANIVKKS